LAVNGKPRTYFPLLKTIVGIDGNRLVCVTAMGKIEVFEHSELSFSVRQADQEVPADKRRAAAKAYCRMLIDFYRQQQEEEKESNGQRLGIL